MEILSILNTLEDLVEKSTGLPLTGKCIVDREEIFEIINEMRLKLPDEIKQAVWINDERQKILQEAKKQANSIVEDAESRIPTLVDEHEITQKAYDKSEEIIAAAQKNAKEIRNGTNDYADGILNKLEDILRDTLNIIERNRQELK
ncbi:MAG: ATPase [Eubacteriales bacterium]|nr:ATPase [Eubacteriales bacterium]